MNQIKFIQIGTIHSPFKVPRGTSIQSVAATEIKGTVEIFPQFAEGMQDMDGFSHVILIYHFHLVKETSLKVVPFMDDQMHGIFSTRAPNRPNPIGISVVRLVRIEGNILHIQDLDIVDGTPLLDMKPYVPEFDVRDAEKSGWLQKNMDQLSTKKDDGRFAGKSDQA